MLGSVALGCSWREEFDLGPDSPRDAPASSPAEFVQALVTDAEVVAYFMDHGAAYLVDDPASVRQMAQMARR